MIPNLRFDPDDPYPDSDGQPMAENTEQYEWIGRWSSFRPQAESIVGGCQ